MKYIVRNINDYNDNEIYSFFNSIPEFKKTKINKLKRNVDKKRSIIGEMILAQLLDEKNIFYDEVIFNINEYGKPYITNKNIFYNISHSGEYVVVCISYKEIGVDIEKIKKTNYRVVSQFATSLEKEYIFSDNKDIEERLFLIFTLKEAYFKMKGTNLNNVLDIEFKILDDDITCNDYDVNLWVKKDITGYVISICEKK